MISACMLTSCGLNSGLVNQLTLYGNNTQVVLQEANYRIIGQVSGTAADSYILGIGGFKKNLVELAKNDMYRKAEMEGKSRAIINMGLERHKSRILMLYSTHSITVHGTLIEFTKP